MVDTYEAICPHCQAKIDLSCGLQAVNLAVGSSYEKPDYVLDGWHFFFRDYLPSFENYVVVGCALAWKREEDRYYGCIAGAGEPFEYKKGSVFPRPYGTLSPIDYEERGIGPFVAAKNEALAKLKKFVIEQEGLNEY